MESYNGILCTKIDALYLIQAAKENLIPLITQRFSSYERQTYIKSGSVFIWNENNSNIKRWTDGRKWSASRVSGVFLSYKEMKPAKSATCHIVDEKDNGLLKQSFSYSVGDEKYHIVSYIDSDVGTDAVGIDNYQRPSLDERFKNLEIDGLLKEDSQTSYTNRPKRKSISDDEASAVVSGSRSTTTASTPISSSDELADFELNHIAKKRNTSIASIVSLPLPSAPSSARSSLASIVSIPATPISTSPKSPLPSIMLSQSRSNSISGTNSYISSTVNSNKEDGKNGKQPIILPPLQNIMPFLVKQDATAKTNDFDRDTLLALKCSFSG